MPAIGPKPYYFSAATGAADVDRHVTSANMKVGAYTVANSGTQPSPGARRVTITHTSGDTTDTLGTITVVGTDLAGTSVSETLTPVADDVVTGEQWFVTITSVTGAGWVIDGVEGTEDTITVGCTGAACIKDTSGMVHAVFLGETAAGSITLADSTGTIAVLKASIIEASYDLDFAFEDYLTVVAAGASKFTVSVT